MQERMQVSDLVGDRGTAVSIAHEGAARLQLDRLGDRLDIAVLAQCLAHIRHGLMLEEAQPA
jgi:hypothetical protein